MIESRLKYLDASYFPCKIKILTGPYKYKNCEFHNILYFTNQFSFHCLSLTKLLKTKKKEKQTKVAGMIKTICK